MAYALRRSLSVCVAASLAAGASALSAKAQQPSRSAPDSTDAHRALVTRYCVSCHNDRLKTGGLALETLAAQPVADAADVWEKVVRKLRARQMPPVGTPRPDEATYEAAIASLEASLDRAAAARRIPAGPRRFRRLNRTEYQNAIRDLLALDIDAAVAAAGRRVQSWLRQRDGGRSLADAPGPLHHGGAEDQPAGGRASGPVAGRRHDPDSGRTSPRRSTSRACRSARAAARSIPYTFPQDGEYEIQIRLARDRNEHVEGLREPHELEVLLDRERVQLFTVKPPQRAAGSRKTISPRTHGRRASEGPRPVTAGPHELGVTFLKNPSSLLETKRQPYQAHFNMHRHPRIPPAVYPVSITGPYAATGPGRHAQPPPDLRLRGRRSLADEERVRQTHPLHADAPGLPAAGRRDADLQGPMEFYREARAEEGFDAGIEMALSAVLVNPEFLFRVEQDPAGVAPNDGLSHQRSRARVAPLVLPLEQHSGRRAARPGRARRSCSKPGGARAAGAADAGRSRGREAW